MADCVRCGGCCRAGACSYGKWDPKKRQCSYLTENNLCGEYDKIKDLPGSTLSPAFGTGCSSTLGNTYRQKILAERHGTPIQFAKACYNAVPDFISPKEADEAVESYEQEWGNGQN